MIIIVKEELKNRLQELRKQMKANNLDSYIITDELDVWYLTNITYSPEERPFFIIVPLEGKPQLVVPKMEERHLGEESNIDVDIISYWDNPSPEGDNWFDHVNQVIKDFTRTGIENNVKASIFFEIEANELISLDLVTEMRKVKTPYEVEQIRHTCKIADDAMAYMLNSAKKGDNILGMFAVAGQIQEELVQAKKFNPILSELLTVVWPAPGSAMPHGVPDIEDTMENGPHIAMSYFRVDGYAAENERTFFVEQPSDKEREIFQIMMEAREAALAKLKPGVKTAEVDNAANEVINNHGLKNALRHRTGHGIGLNNHEGSFIAEGSKDVLQENMVISIEPGIYLDGIGGFRHSDTVLVTKDGYEILTHAPTTIEELTLNN
ncbi:M24 family metallopeptidase [Staphylococcus durrellii]|uniref:M24 family metallopeptidase n=1 Tax=Staphylococcus durrellii TaxID=2781773 RepID=UPI001ABB3D2F|nr:Xaa-Pro peptidase family protein [Staphylococcus durrellii]